MSSVVTSVRSFLDPLHRECARGKFPPISALPGYLGEFAEEERDHALVDLANEHLTLSWKEGKGCYYLDAYVEAFGKEFPAEFAVLEDIDPDLAEAEFLARLRYAPAGDGATIEEVTRRFPDRQDILQRLNDRYWLNPRYCYLDDIQEGGMGCVGLYFDFHLRRVVAIKAPHEELTSSPEMIRRFKEEAQVTAGLAHPGIVSVHELEDSSSDQPYYVMQFVQGKSLRAWIEEYRKKQNRNELREVVRSVLSVCAALAYAHSRGVIHRDLKPDNILVGPFGEVFVGDWGLGKRFVAHGIAQTNSGNGQATRSPAGEGYGEAGIPREQGQGTKHIGSLEYMPPEHLEGYSDERSDVFGVGAILYHVLTGKPPYNPRNNETEEEHLERLGRIAKAEFARPKVRGTAMSALAAICLRAMRRDARERYPSMTDLADDIQNWLQHKAVAAYPENGFRRYRSLLRQPRRRPWLPLGLLSTFALGVVLFFAYQWADWRSVEAKRTQAEETLLQVQRKIDADKLPIARDLLVRLLGSLPERAEFDSLRDRAKEALNEVDEDLRRSQEAQAFPKTAAEAEFHLLGAYWALRPHEETGERRRIPRSVRGFASLQVGIDLAKKSLKPFGLPENLNTFLKQPFLHRAKGTVVDLRPRVGELLFLWALAEERLGQGKRREEHHAACRQAIRLLELAEAVGNRSQLLYTYRARFLDQLGDRAKADEARRRAKGLERRTFLDHHFRAATLVQERQLEEALRSYQLAQEHRSDHYWNLFRMAKTYENLGVAKRSREEISRAEALFRACIALRPNDPTPYNNRGILLLQLKRYDEAADLFQKALDLDNTYLLAWGNLALAQAERKQPAAAEAVATRFQRTFPGANRELARLYGNIGIAHERREQYSKAISYYDKALQLVPDSAGTLRNRAVSLINLARLQEAEADLVQAIKLASGDGELHYILGNLYAKQGLNDKAIACYDHAITLDPKLRDAWYNRGVVQRRCKHYDEAIRNQTEALNLRPEAPIDPLLERATAYAASARFHESFKDLDIILVLQPDHLDALITRGKVLGDLNDLWRSEQDFDRAIQIAPKEPAAYRGRGLTRFRTENWAGAIADWRSYLEQVPDAPDRGSILNDISVAYLKLNMPNEAIQALDAALAIRPDASWQTNRGNVLLQQGELRQAIASFDRALERDRTHTRAWALRGQAHLRQGHHAEAVSDLDQALALEPGVYETLLFRGLAHFHQGSPEKARKDWEVLVTDRPEHVRGRFARGGLHLLDKQYPQAAMELARVLDDNILRPFALALLAQTHLESGGPSVPVAVRYAKDLVQALPKDALAHLTAARILAQATKTAGNDQATAWRGEALEYLHSAINLSDEVKGWVEGDPIFDALRKDPKFPR